MSTANTQPQRSLDDVPLMDRRPSHGRETEPAQALDHSSCSSFLATTQAAHPNRPGAVTTQQDLVPKGGAARLFATRDELTRFLGTSDTHNNNTINVFGVKVVLSDPHDPLELTPLSDQTISSIEAACAKLFQHSDRVIYRMSPRTLLVATKSLVPFSGYTLSKFIKLEFEQQAEFAKDIHFDAVVSSAFEFPKRSRKHIHFDRLKNVVTARIKAKQEELHEDWRDGFTQSLQ